MANKAVSANERMNRELLAALRAGQIMRGDSDLDTAKIMPNCKSTYYQRKRDPERFTIRDLRLQARNCVSKLVDATGELRAAERSVKKMTQKSISFPLAEQHIKNLESERRAVREELEIAGGSIAYVLDLWQRAGATLADLCNLCNRDYAQVLHEIKEERRDREFSSLIFACNLDFKDPRDRGWLTFDVDAPLTHAVKEFYLREMIGTPEGRAASHRALEEPGCSVDALSAAADLLNSILRDFEENIAGAEDFRSGGGTA